MKTVCLWSGGKDSCLAAYRAKMEGHDIAAFINFTDRQKVRSLSHGLAGEVIRKQAMMTGIPLLQKAMPKDGYRNEFKALVNEWKEKSGIEGIIFGDIYLQGHKDWIDAVCSELHMTPLMPLWGHKTSDLIDEFIRAGFKAIVVSVKADILGEEWLGRKVDTNFVEGLNALGGIDLCGENGEFHTFVYDGPIFKGPVEFRLGNKTLQDARRFLELD